MLWTEKYGPKNFEEVLGNIKVKKEIMEWTEEWLKGKPQKCLLLVGPPGTGKTTMAHLAAKEFSEFVELNASDKRSYDIIKNTIGESALSRSLFGEGLKLIILDEVDGIHGTEDRGGTRAIGNIIKEGKHPLIMMANDPYSKRLTSLKTKCNVIKLRKVHTNSIVALLKKICVKEKIEFEEHVLRTLAKQSKGDLRSAINDLEAIAAGKKKVTSEDLELIGKKDEIVNIFDSVRTVLKSRNIHHIKDAMKVEAQPNFILELVAENIPREYEKAEEISKAYEMVSLADTYLGRAFQTRAYTYWKYSYQFMSLGVALAKAETYKKFAKYTTSSVYTKLSKNRAKRDLRDAVAEKIGEKLHSSKKVAREQFPYFEIMFQDDEIAYEIATYFGLDDKEVKLFRSKKIKVKKAKPTHKTSAKSKSNTEKDVKKDSEKYSGKSKKPGISKRSKETSSPSKSDAEKSETPKTRKTVKKAKRSQDKEEKTSKDKKAKSGEESSNSDKKDKQTSLFNF
jgi:replication factor C large subunit